MNNTPISTLLKVYIDHPHYIKPPEITKVFKLHNKWAKIAKQLRNPVGLHKADREVLTKQRDGMREELMLLLKVITASDNITFQLTTWKDGNGADTSILEIYEPLVTESLFTKE